MKFKIVPAILILISYVAVIGVTSEYVHDHYKKQIYRVISKTVEVKMENKRLTKELEKATTELQRLKRDNKPDLYQQGVDDILGSADALKEEAALTNYMNCMKKKVGEIPVGYSCKDEYNKETRK